jgi:hypothetical protein
MHEIVDTEVFGVVEPVVQVGGLDTGLDVDIPTFGLVAASAFAATVRHHGLTLVRSEPVILRGLRVGFNVGFVMATAHRVGQDAKIGVTRAEGLRPCRCQATSASSATKNSNTARRDHSPSFPHFLPSEGS